MSTRNANPGIDTHQIMAAGLAATWQGFGVVADQRAALERDVRAVRSHPLVPDTVPVGGFLYDVDTGLLEQLV